MTRIPISLVCLRVLAILDGLVLIRIILLCIGEPEDPESLPPDYYYYKKGEPWPSEFSLPDSFIVCV